MIVTRRRRRRAHPERYLIPLLIVAAVGFSIGFPPTQRLIENSPLRPVWNAGVSVGSALMRPLSFAGQQDAITQKNREIRDLNARLETERKGKIAAETRAQQLEQQLNALANQPAPTAVPTPKRSADPAGFAAARGRTTTDDKRLASTWAAMEPEKAAAVVQRLPDAQVTRVLAQMDADSAGAIMNALPPGVAARISRAQAQVRSSSDR